MFQVETAIPGKTPTPLMSLSANEHEKPFHPLELAKKH